MDVAAYLKQGLKDMHVVKDVVKEQAIERKQFRRARRDEMLIALRQISDSPLLPTPAPVQTRSKVKGEVRKIEYSPTRSPPVQEIPPQKKKPDRLELLKVWKAKRDEAREVAKKKQKPLFKWSKTVEHDNADSIYKDDKRKVMASSVLKLADDGHQFKAPKNVKPIALKSGGGEPNPPKVYEARGAVTRSRAKLQSAPSVKPKPKKETVKAAPKLKKEVKEVVPLKSALKKSDSSETMKTRKSVLKISEVSEETKPSTRGSSRTAPKKSILKTPTKKSKGEVSPKPKTPSKSILKKTQDETDKHIDASNTSKSSDSCVTSDSFNTPEKSEKPVAYVSPFVTMSRGKNSARKEYKSRHSKGGLSVESPDLTGHKAGAAYFTKQLDEEIQRIEAICAEWTSYKEENEIPEEADDMINVAIGQSNLLMSKKMQTFRQLISDCREQNTTPLVTCEDLHGYWDMLLIQIGNVDKRLENLTTLKSNSWEEIIPVRKTRAAKQKPQAAAKPGKVSSSLRNAIKAARQKAKGLDVPKPLEEEIVYDGGFFVVKSPQKRTSVRTPSKGKSLLHNVLSVEVKKHLKESPGLTMLKVSQLAKTSEKSEGVTPSKSILKSRNSCRSAKKAVLFNEKSFNYENESHEDDESSKENEPNGTVLLDLDDYL